MAVNTSGSILNNAFGQPLEIGSTAAGAITVDGGTVLEFNAGVTGENLFTRVGVGGTGTLNVDGTGTIVRYLGNGAGEIGFQIGRTAQGNSAITNGASVELIDAGVGTTQFTGFSIARNAGSTGNMTIDASSLSSSGYAVYSNVGRDSATGTMTLQNAATYTATGTQEAGMQIGRDAGSMGTLNIASGASVSITSGVSGQSIQSGLFAGTYFNLGRDGGTGTINANNGTLNLISTVGESGMNIGRATSSSGTINLVNGSLWKVEASASGSGDPFEGDTYANIGRDGGVGILNVANSTVDFDGDDDSQINVGRDGGTGTINLNASNMTIDADDFARLRIGVDFGTPGGNGTLKVENGSTLNITGNDAGLAAAYNSNSTGLIQILSGSQVNITRTGTMDELAYLRAGYQANSNGTILIDGAGTSVTAHHLDVGSIDLAEGMSNDTTMGQLTISNGASLTVVDAKIGRGGEVILDGGTITAGSGGMDAGLYLAEGKLRIAAGSNNTFNGDFYLEDESDLQFDMTNNEAIGALTINAPRLESISHDEIIDTTGTTFLGGESGTYFSGTFDAIVSNFDPQNDQQVLGQSSAFAWMIEIVSSGVGSPGATFSKTFVAMSAGDGSNRLAVDAGATGTDALMIDYNSDTGFAAGDLGAKRLDIKNVTTFSGSSVTDNFIVTGTAGTTPLTFDGRGGNDTMSGGLGGDILIGGTGADTMIGGAGDDIYQVDDVGDIVTEIADEGSDIVDTFISLTIPVNVEVLRLQGTANLDANGSGERDIIIGNAGNNTIDGADGLDVMQGGAGNDTYAVDNSSDAVIEAMGEGQDAVYSSVDYEISGAQEIETAILTGTATVLRGSDSDNQLFGNDQINVIDGRGGTDFMLGGGGADIFQINLEPGAVDLVADFSKAEGDRMAFTGFNAATTFVNQASATSFEVRDTKGTQTLVDDTVQTFQLWDSYDPANPQYTQGALVFGVDYYFG